MSDQQPPEVVYACATDADDATDPLAIPRTASVHEQTVKAASIHARAWESARKPIKAPGRNRSGPVTERRLNPDAWKVALDLADGDARRIEIHDDDTFTVHNERIK